MKKNFSLRVVYFRRLVNTVAAKFGEHVAVHCKQRQKNPVIACEQCRIGLRRVAEWDYDAKRGKQSHACQQHRGRGLKMSLFLFKNVSSRLRIHQKAAKNNPKSTPETVRIALDVSSIG
jgi:hypothetical protein